MTLAPKQGVLDISIYVGGRSEATGAARTIKLSSNESPFGPSSAALAALNDAKQEVGVYPEGSSRLLRDALAEFHHLPAERIVCGNGSDEILTLLANAYLRPKDEVLMGAHSFPIYKIATQANSATPIEIPEPDLKMDVDAVLAKVTGRTRLVYIGNPNNPTGTYLTVPEVKKLHDGLPASVLLVIDAAYAEYVTRNDYDAGFSLVNSSDNVVVTRTFSKAYGLAGLRVGWAYAPQHVADNLNRLRAPFNVNIGAQRAAVAALHDRAHTAHAIQHNEEWRKILTEQIRALGLPVTESAANFVLIHFPEENGKRAADADRFLMERGIILRGMSGYGLPACLRLTVGTEEANKLVVATLAEFLK